MDACMDGWADVYPSLLAWSAGEISGTEPEPSPAPTPAPALGPTSAPTGPSVGPSAAPSGASSDPSAFEATTYSYLGCFRDDLSARVLPVLLLHPYPLVYGMAFTIAECFDWARAAGYKLFGVQWSSAPWPSTFGISGMTPSFCWAGSDTGRAMSLGPGVCDTPCYGNPGQICGGALSLSLYMTSGEYCTLASGMHAA